MERINYQDIPEGMFDKLMEVETYVNSSSISMNLLELIRLRVSQVNRCAYCVDMHHKELEHLGESDLRLSSLCVWQETPYFDDKEVVALQFADELTRLAIENVAESTINALEEHFSKHEICYLALAISQINTWTRLMKTFKFTPGNYQVQEYAQ